MREGGLLHEKSMKSRVLAREMLIRCTHHLRHHQVSLTLTLTLALSVELTI